MQVYFSSALMLALVCCATNVFANSVQDARLDIRSTYDFDPSKMTFDEQESRAPTLSALWNRYTKSPQVYAPALRAELLDSLGTPLLYCDGGMLLLNKSKAEIDQALGIKSLEQCSLAEIQQTPYFYTAHALAVQGVDTFALQVKMLSKPMYSIFIVQHALSLGQDYAFLYPLLVQEESVYVPKLIARLQEEKDPVAQQTLVLSLWYAATPEAENAINEFANTKGSSPARVDARELLQKLEIVRKWAPDDPKLERIQSSVKVSDGASDAELRAIRRARMRSISDEALYDLEAYTVLIYRANQGV